MPATDATPEPLTSPSASRATRPEGSASPVPFSRRKATVTGMRMSPPPGEGWIELPVAAPKARGLTSRGRAKARDRDLGTWAHAAARDSLPEGSDPGSVARRSELLTLLTSGGRDRGETLAYVWLPDPDAGPLARLSVTEQGQLDLGIEQLEQTYAWRDEETRALEASRVDLPIGRAVRVRREQGADPTDTVIEIGYALSPPRVPTTILYSMYWALSEDDPVLTQIADSVIHTLRVG